MAEITYSSKIGVSEAVAKTLNKAKMIIGTVDENGDNIGIVDIQLRVFHKLPTLIMLIFLVPVLAGYFFQTPLSWIPINAEPYTTWHTIKYFQVFTLGSWILAVIAYIFFAFCVLLKNNFYSGVEGAYIVFQRYGKIVKILTPGSCWINFDWRITPEYVVSSKKFILSMPRVQGKEKSNHTMHHSGALIAHIEKPDDAHKLISKGGFKNVITALIAIYTPSVKDLLKTTTADTFNTFLVEPIGNAAILKDDSRELDEISKQNLSIELIEKLARIDNVDIGSIDLTEIGGVRDIILPMLAIVAKEYGIKLEEYVPFGNSVNEDFLSTKVIGLISILERLKQASDNLYDIINEEWDEDIQSAVAGKKVGALEIKKIIDEMVVLMTTMLNASNINNIFEQKSKAIQNIMEGHIGSILAEIETLQNKISSKSIEMTGLELYITELDGFIKSLDTKESIKALVPKIETVFISDMSQGSMLPTVDAINAMLEVTGMDKVLDRLKEELEPSGTKTQNGNLEEIEKQVSEIQSEASAIKIENVLADLQEKMDAVKGDSGMDITAFKWDSIKARIDNIKECAGVEDDENTSIDNVDKPVLSTPAV